ncbi:MAG: hypothetical protein HYX92_21095 [Chloroflexi bacterium]|nr:hypothetical protein [Chloroflexota bacterium]
MAITDRVRTPDSLEEINEIFYRERMTDGLPIIPPTVERVQRMLEAVDRDPQEVIGLVAPKQGVATVEKIAANAVMAGCLPEYLPVVIAAVQAIVEEGFNLYGIQTTTNPITPLFLVNGPVAKKLHINSGYNCLGEGNRANATIGRCLRLIMINVGGGLAGDTDRATQGQPGRYSFCLAESEDESPWPAFHHDLGFSADSSTVTAFGAGGNSNIRPYAATGREFLAGLARMMAIGGSPRHGWALIIICPEHARLIARDGYSKEDARRYLFENARLRVSGFTPEVAEAIINEPVMEFMDVRRVVGELNADTYIPCANRVEDMHIVVAGGAGGHCAYIPGCSTQVTHAVTKLIR